MPNHFTSIVFGLKGAVYYEAIAMVIFSHVKITCYFHTWSPPSPWAMSILVILSNRWQETESVWKWFGEHWWRYSSSKSLNFTKICMFGRTNLPRPQHTNICKFSQIGELNLCLFKTYQFQIWQFSYYQGALSRGVDRFSVSCPHQKLKIPGNGLLQNKLQVHKICK